MNLTYTLRESLHAISSNPLRSGLSILGVIFGVASVVAMLAIGLGAEKEIERLLDALGARNIHITRNELEEADWNRVIRSSMGLSRRDADVVRSVFSDYPGTELGWSSLWLSDDASLPLLGSRLSIYGVTANFRRLLELSIEQGRWFTPREANLAKPVCILGASIAKTWFSDPKKAIGSKLRIERSWFEIIGILEDKKNTPHQDQSSSKKELSAKNQDTSSKVAANDEAPLAASEKSAESLGLVSTESAIFLPYASALERLGPAPLLSPIERIIIKLPLELDPVLSREKLTQTLAKLHRDAQVLTITSADEVIAQKRATSRLFSYFLMTIAMISLIVGGIGIANVMLAGMVERIREVGLRRAIGAKKRHILWQFLSESLTICLLGGFIGGFVGLFVSWLIGSISGWTIVFPWWGQAIAMLIASIVGVGSGLYPAILASRISPIEALQGRA